jgi:ribosomal protein S18 acetylase RimI-like enzyme
VALVTRIAESTAHLVQLAVDPQMRGRHLGTQLLEIVCSSANQAGCTHMTLFVGGRNSAARSLYESSRFESRASFVAAGSLQPRRSTSVAPGSAVITRR